jgi:hypothetical protein
MSIRGVSHFFRGYFWRCLRSLPRGIYFIRWRGCPYYSPTLGLMAESIVVGGYFDCVSWIAGRGARGLDVLLVDAGVDRDSHDLSGYCDHCVLGSAHCTRLT